MNAPGASETIFERLATSRSHTEILRRLHADAGPAIGAIGVCVLFQDAGSLRIAQSTGIDPATEAVLLEPTGPVVSAIEAGKAQIPDSVPALVVAPFGTRPAGGALVTLWNRHHDCKLPLTERLAQSVSLALAHVLLLDGLPHLLFSLDARAMFEPFGQGWLEYGMTPDASPSGLDRLSARLHPEERQTVCERLTAASSTGARLYLEHRLLHQDGGFRWFRTEASRIGAEHVGSCTEIDALVLARLEAKRQSDVLERQLFDELNDRTRTEVRLAKAERIEAVGQLTSGVAHDFNNLLTVIIGNIEFLEASCLTGGGLDARARSRLAAMRDAAERGGNLTRQLLAFARRQRLEPRPTDLNDTVAELRGLLPAATGGGIEVVIALQDGLWPAFVDRTQIERMILNLALNAHDAMEVGGAVTIATRNRPVDAAAADALGLPDGGDYVEISVSDTGRGMSPAALSRAFEPFFTTKPPGKGSGLGLAQVYGFARQSGGIVTLRSVVGEGTQAAILLPRAHLEAASDTGMQPPEPAAFAIPPVPDGPVADGPVAEGPQPMPPRLVLLVDDDQAVREVTSVIVAEAGYQVIEAASGSDALDRLSEAGRVDLMVTDYAMPGMNGHELSRAARRRQPDLKVLFVTGYADLTLLADTPDQRILLKPFRAAALLDKIGGVLAN